MQRHEVVAEAAKQSRDDDEEHHQDAVRRDNHVPQLAVRFRAIAVGKQAGAIGAHVLHTRIHQFHAHVDREGHCDEPDDAGSEEV